MNPYKCPRCGATFATQEGIDAHLVSSLRCMLVAKYMLNAQDHSEYTRLCNLEREARK